MQRIKEDPVTLANEGLKQGFSGNYQDAIETFDRALYLSTNLIEGRETRSEILNYKAVALQELDKMEESLPVLDESLKIDPKNAYALHNKAATLFELERYEEAVLIIEKAIKNLNDDEESEDHFLHTKAVILTFLERPNEAIPIFEQLIKNDPDSWQAWFGKGDALSDLEKYDEALVALNKALKGNPEDEDLLESVGNLFLDTKKYEDALGCFEKILELDPGDELGWYNKACTLSLLNKKEEASDALFVAVSLEPENLVGMRDEEDFENIKNTERFQQLLNRPI